MVVMSREQSLRQLIFKCNKELLKEEGMTRTDLHDLTTWVLSNAAINKLTADEIFITEGNYLGLGESNYDRVITLPRFMSFQFGRIDFFGFINNRQKTFRLKSYADFSELESYLAYTEAEAIVVIDGELVTYKKQGHNTWGWEIIWGCDAYIVTFVAEDREFKEVLKSKVQLQNRLMQLVAEEAKEIKAYNILSGESLDFLVRKDIYTTKPSKGVDSLCLTWYKDMRDDDEEVMF